MTKGFQEGHPYHAPKQPVKGLGGIAARRRTELAVAVRDRLPAETLVEFHVQRACGRRAYLDDSGDEITVRVEANGLAPSDEQIAESVRWLSDRGWGTPVQSVALQAHIVSSGGQGPAPVMPDTLPPGVGFAFARAFALEREARELAARKAAPIDVTATETRDPVPAQITDQGHDPAPGIIAK